MKKILDVTLRRLKDFLEGFEQKSDVIQKAWVKAKGDKLENKQKAIATERWWPEIECLQTE